MDIRSFVQMSKTNIKQLLQILAGDEDVRGLIDFKSMVTDEYLRLRKICGKMAKDPQKMGVVGKFFDRHNITVDDYDKLFSFSWPESHEFSSSTLASKYFQLASGITRLSNEKLAKLYGKDDKSSKREQAIDFAVEVDAIEYLNRMFVEYMESQRQMTREFHPNNTKYNMKKDDMISLIKINNDMSTLTKLYNEKILDDENGIKQLYSAVAQYLRALQSCGIIKGCYVKAEFPESKYSPLKIDCGRVNF